MQTTDAVAIAMQHAHEYVSPTAWGELRHQVHVAQQEDRIRKALNAAAGSFVRTAEGFIRMPMATILDHANTLPAAAVNMEIAMRMSIGGRGEMCEKYMRAALDAAIASIADVNATALDNGEKLPLDFVLWGA